MTSENKTSVEIIFGQIMADLHEAQEVVESINDQPTRERLELFLSRAERGMKDLQQLQTVMEDTGRPEAPAAEEFARDLTAIKEKWPERDRLELITDMARSRHYSSEQVRAILETFSFDDNKVEAAIRLYPKLTDPENFFQAIQAINFPSSRDDLRKKLNLK